MTRTLRVFCLLLVTCLVATLPAFPQASGTGGISGSVKDPSGGIIPNASVSVRNLDTGIETKAVTTGTGDYRLTSLATGRYTVRVTYPGFQTVERTGVRVVLGETVTVEIELPVGATSTVTTVTAEATALDTTSTTTGTTRVAEELQDLPLQVNGGERNVNLFLTTLAGVAYRGGAFGGAGAPDHPVVQGVGDTSGYRSVALLKVDGQIASGTTNQALVGSGGINTELVKEFRLSTNQDAENGWDMGSSVELVTKAGTNKYHGTVYEFLRNHALDSRYIFASEVSVDRQHEFGAVVSGPILKSKLFFLASYSGYRRVNAPGGVIQSVPTAKMRDGDFSEWLGAQTGTDSLGRPIYFGQIYNPATTRSDGRGGFTRDPFPGNVIPTTMLSPISTFFQKYLPLPTRRLADRPFPVEQNWVGTLRPGKTPRDNFNFKLDHEIGNHRLSGFYQDDNFSTDGVSFAAGIGWLPKEVDLAVPVKRFGWRTRSSYNWAIRANLLFSANLAITRGISDDRANEESKTLATQAGLRGTQNPGTPEVYPGRVSRFGSWQPRVWGSTTTIPAKANLGWVKGRHELKFGGEYMVVAAVSGLERQTVGTFMFADRETGLPDIANTGNGYASYLLGDVDSATMSTTRAMKYGTTIWGLFAQDRWRVTPRLTLSYGLRWDVFVPATETYDRMGVFDPNVPNPAAGGRLGGLTFYGEGAGRNGRDHLINTVYKNFGPRLGIAYLLDQKTVIRAYYGLQYYPINNIGAHAVVLPAYGWLSTVTPTTLNNGVTAAFNWNNGFPGITPTLPTLNPALQNGSEVVYVDPKEKKVGTSQGLGFSIERRLPFNLTVKAEYVGKLNHGIFTDGLVGLNQLDLKYLSLGSLLNANINSAQARAANIPIPYPGFAGSVQQALRPYPQYGNIPQLNAMVSSTLYHSLQLNVQKRFSHGLNFLFAYTIQKSLTTDDLASIGTGTGARELPHSTLRHLSKHLTYNSDRPQMVSLSWVYELPFGKGKPFLSTAHPVVRHILGGWQLGAIQNYGKGLPVRILAGGGVPFGGPAWAVRKNEVPVRTNVSCADYDPNDPNSRYLNISAFSTPPAFTIGNTHVLPDVRGCGYMNENISLKKKFSVHEDWKVEMGADFFNIFNRHYWDNYSLTTVIGAPATFGRYSRASNPRTIQLNMRIRF